MFHPEPVLISSHVDGIFGEATALELVVLVASLASAAFHGSRDQRYAVAASIWAGCAMIFALLIIRKRRRRYAIDRAGVALAAERASRGEEPLASCDLSSSSGESEAEYEEGATGFDAGDEVPLGCVFVEDARAQTSYGEYKIVVSTKAPHVPLSDSSSLWARFNEL